jgi:hypothetical protein
MYSIFDILKGVLFTKSQYPIQYAEEEKNVDTFMLNRWISMVDGDSAKIINETTNKYGSIFHSKKTQYNFLKTILPKYKFHKINYIKKKTVD